MSRPVRIFLSYDTADSKTALDVQRQLRLLAQPRELVFWDSKTVPIEAFRKQAAAFLEKADLFVAVLSMNYQDTPDVFWEATHAVAVQRDQSGDAEDRRGGHVIAADREAVLHPGE